MKKGFGFWRKKTGRTDGRPRENSRFLKLAAVCCWLIVFFLPLPVLADSLDDKLEILQQRAAEQQRRSAQAAEEMAGVAVEIQRLDEEVAAASSDYREIRSLLNTTEGKIAEMAAIFQEKEAKLKEKVAVLKKRLRDIYMHGQVSYLDVLFGASDFHDFVTRMDIWKSVVKADLNLVQSITAEMEQVKKIQEDLEKTRQQQAALAKVAAEREAQIVAQRTRKKTLMDGLVSDKESADRAYAELVAASKEVQRLIKRRQLKGKGTTVGGRGSMIWPLDGVITSEYGWRIHPITGDRRYHSGMDIGGDYGDEIIAAAGGTVIHSGWISGYGYTIILDHGGGITSLYGHNQSLAVRVGEEVSQGQTIAYCGSTGNSTGPHCHFEVRIDGELADPYDYL